MFNNIICYDHVHVESLYNVSSVLILLTTFTRFQNNVYFLLLTKNVKGYIIIQGLDTFHFYVPYIFISTTCGNPKSDFLN